MHEEPLKTWFHEARHKEAIAGINEPQDSQEEWRKIKDRMKTVSVALVLCLNVGVDPPDTIKPNPCARREAWVDPALMNPIKVPQHVASMLQKTYERLQPRARYKAAIDPTVEYVRKLCAGMRKSAKEERILFHFNGHGVPKPTAAGEIWVFNKQITQYIPLSLFDLLSWMGTPSVYVWDCHSAGTIVEKCVQFANDQKVYDIHSPAPPKTSGDFTDAIHLGACDVGELLPTDPDLPADLFTSCLTTPIQTSMLWYVIKTNSKDKYSLQMIESLPGTLTDRKSTLGELNWIFTAITDTIAWNRLKKPVFQKLFRQDLLVASLFRSYLLAEKIMRDHGCKVVSRPKLPCVYDHPLWDYWEYVIELCLVNLYNRANKPKIYHFSHNDCFMPTHMAHSQLVDFENGNGYGNGADDFNFNLFFIEQLQAFEVWLRFDSTRKTAPDQLPVVLQVLLSQVHRVKALELLARFVDIGRWAVLDSLFVGVFPYLLKLLQSETKELRPALAFIWAKVLIVDPKCCEDLIGGNGTSFVYFSDILKDSDVAPKFKIIPVFVICCLIAECGQEAKEKFFWVAFIETAIDLLSQPEVQKCKMLCMWLLIGLGKLWNNYDVARWQAVRLMAYVQVTAFLSDSVPEVRAAAVYALGQLMSNRSAHNEHATAINNDICDKICDSCAWDGSVLVRLELVVAIQWFILDYREKFSELYIELNKNLPSEDGQMPNRNGGSANSTLSSVYKPSPIEDRRKILFKQWKYLENKTFNNSFERVWVIVLRLYFDPMEQVRCLAVTLVDNVVESAEELKQRAFNDNPKDVHFTIGSPNNEVNADRRSSNSLSWTSRARNRTSSSNSEVGGRPVERIQTSSTINTPKRRLYGSKADSQSNLQQPSDQSLNAIVNTEFVQWSSKIFTSGIYRTIYDEDCLTARNWMVDGVSKSTCLLPSDWALHSSEGVQQYARQDVERIRSSRSTFQLTFPIQFDNTIHCIEWSYLRPYVYLCDGRNVSAFNTSGQSMHTASSFCINVNEDPLFDDPLSDIIIINERNLELLMMGTQDGLVSVWDPGFDEHSHDVVRKPKMLTSNHLFNDQTRVYESTTASGKRFSRLNLEDKSNHTLYQWDQDNGRLLCGGNVRIVRIWDAWTEKKTLDISLDQKWITTAFCADFQQDLVCVGSHTGVISVFDVRIAETSSRIMRIPNPTRSKMVGCSFVSGTPQIVCGHEDGTLKIYDPRQFAEPLDTIDVHSQKNEHLKLSTASLTSLMSNGTLKKPHPNPSMLKLVVHANNKFAACSLSDGTVKLFDLSLKEEKPYALPAPSVHQQPAGYVSTMRFHERRLQLGMATSKNVFGYYYVG